MIETFFDLAHLLLAVDEARRAADMPVIASMTFGEDLVLADGTTPARALAALTGAGVDAIGVNCGVGPAGLPRRPRPAGSAGEGEPARSVMPNAGLPQRLEGRFVYAAEPAYFGRIVPRLLDAGARIIGGCCGTTPDHIAAMRAALGGHHDRGPAPHAGPRGRARPPQPRRRGEPPRRLRGGGRAGRRGRRPPAGDAPRPRPRRRPLRHLRRDRPAAQHPDRPHDRRGAAAPGRRHGRGQHQRLRDGAGPHGRDGGRLRHPARRRTSSASSTSPPGTAT